VDTTLLLAGTFIVGALYAEFSRSAAIPVLYGLLAVETSSWEDWWVITFLLLLATLFTRFMRAASA
jgi:hypothetical protein